MNRKKSVFFVAAILLMTTSASAGMVSFLVKCGLVSAAYKISCGVFDKKLPKRASEARKAFTNKVKNIGKKAWVDLCDFGDHIERFGYEAVDVFEENNKMKEQSGLGEKLLKVWKETKKENYKDLDERQNNNNKRTS